MNFDALSGWRRLTYGPLASKTALVAAAALSLPFCAVGLFMDDYHQQLLLEGASRMPGSRWDLFTLAPGDPARMQSYLETWPYPWWSLPKLHFSFLRPLSAALANFDTLVFGRAFAWQHLHSVLWYVALVAVVAALLRRALGAASTVAALATLLFAIDGAHFMVVGWLANRNALVATLPAVLGILAHIRWREHGWRWGLPLSLLGYGAGLAGGETALSVLAYLAAYEVMAGPGHWRARALALLPVAALGAVYLAVYRAMGCGSFGSESYTDPVREPLTFLVQVPPRALAMAGGQFVGVMADLWFAAQAARPAQVVAGMLAVLLMTWLLRIVWPALSDTERRGLRWLALGAALSVVPVLATVPSNRLLLVPSIGGAALIAAVLRHGLAAGRSRLVRVAVWYVLIANVPVSMAGWLVGVAVIGGGAEYQRRSALETPLGDQALAGRVLVFLAPDATATLYMPMVRVWHHKPPPRSWNTLSYAPFDHVLTRTSQDTVELQVVGGRMLETYWEELLRAKAFPVPVGMRVRISGAELTVVALDQGLPSRVRVRFDEDPEAGGYTLANFEGERLVPLTLPAIGQSLLLARPRGLMPK